MMLHGIPTALTGDLLQALDRLGHGDRLLVADANYPAYSVGAPVVEVGHDAPTILRAIRSLVPVDAHDDEPPVILMDAGETTPVQAELRAAVAAPEERIATLSRHEFYVRAVGASLVVRTVDERAYGNLLLRKGVVAASEVGDPA